MPTYRKYPCKIIGCESPALARGWCGKHYERWRRNGSPVIARKRFPDRRGDTEAFLAKAIAHHGDDCLIWPFGLNGAGYGQINRSGKKFLVHRLVCRAAHGIAPSPSHEAAHKCGNGHGACINPRHLRWATRSENAADMVVHGRSNAGLGRKLTPEEVLQIFQCSGESQFRIAQAFGVSQSMVGQIKRGEAWSSVTGGRAA